MFKGASRSLISILTAFSFLMVITTGPLFTREIAPGTDHRNLKPNKTRVLNNFGDWVNVSKKSILAFGVDSQQDHMPPYRLFSFLITGKSMKTKAVKTFQDGFEGSVASISAVSFYNQGSPKAEPPADVAGLVFIAHYHSDEENTVSFKMAPFDSKGKKLAPFTLLRKVTAPKDHRINRPTIAVARGTNAVGVAYSCSFEDEYAWPIAISESRAYFLETGFDGSIIGNQKQISLLNNGKLQQAQVMKPAWTGNNWLIPARSITFQAPTVNQLNSDSNATGNSLLMIYAKRKGDSFKTKTREIEHDDQAVDKFTYAGVQILPSPNSVAGPSAAPLKYLLFGNRDHSGQSDSVLDYTTDYSMLGIKYKGAAVPKKKGLQFKIWDPGLKSRPDDNWSWSDEVISNALLTDNGNYRLFLARTLTVNRASSPAGGTSEEENSVAVYEFTLKGGKATQISEQIIADSSEIPPGAEPSPPFFSFSLGDLLSSLFFLEYLICLIESFPGGVHALYYLLLMYT